MLATLTFGLLSNIYTINYVDLMLTSVAFCKFRTYFQQSAYMMMRWYLVAACLDRFALSSHNMRWKNFVRTYVAYRIVAIIAVTWVILPVPVLFYYNIKGNVCAAVFNLATQYYHACFTLVTGFMLPNLIMVISALLIYRNLVNKRKRRQIMIAQQREITNLTEDTQRKRDRQVLLVLLCQSTAYLITVAPWITFIFYNAVTISVRNKSAERIAIERFITYILEPIQYLFPISSFYLYAMTSSMYRAELMIMIRALLRGKWLNKNHPTESVTNSTENRITPGPQKQLTTTTGLKKRSEEIIVQTGEIIIKQENVAEVANN